MSPGVITTAATSSPGAPRAGLPRHLTRPGCSRPYKPRKRTTSPRSALTSASGQVLTLEDCEWTDEEADLPGCALYGRPPSARPL